MNTIKISHVTEMPTTEWRVGKELLSAFTELDDRLIPQKLFQWERAIRDFNTVSDAEYFWANNARMQAGMITYDFPIGLRWKRKEPCKYDAEISHTQRDLKGNLVEGRFNLFAHQNRKIPWSILFARTCEILESRFAMLHIFTPAQMKSHGVSQIHDRFLAGLDANKTTSPIADVAWAAFYGQEYAHEIPAITLKNAKFSVQKIKNGFLVQTTSNLFDVIDKNSEFLARQAEMKSHFREDFFMSHACFDN